MTLVDDIFVYCKICPLCITHMYYYDFIQHHEDTAHNRKLWSDPRILIPCCRCYKKLNFLTGKYHKISIICSSNKIECAVRVYYTKNDYSFKVMSIAFLEAAQTYVTI